MFDSKILRNYLKSHQIYYYYVDMQIIYVIIMKYDNIHKTQDPEIKDQLRKIKVQFIKYFKESWNLQIISSKNIQKAKQVISTYIEWKIISGSKIPEDYIFDIIHEIYIKYEENRNNIISAINKSEINCKDIIFELESFLFTFLKFHYFKDRFVKENTIGIQVLSKRARNKFHLDHIIELEIVKTVLKRNKIENLNLVTKFIKYFNSDWNIQIIDRKYNSYKHRKVIDWLNWICDSPHESSKSQKLLLYFNKSSKNLDTDLIHEIFLISKIYKSNRLKLKSLISNDFSLDCLQKKKFLTIENDLSNLLKSIVIEEMENHYSDDSDY